MFCFAQIKGKHTAVWLQQREADDARSRADIAETDDGMLAAEEFFRPLDGNLFEICAICIRILCIEGAVGEQTAFQIMGEGRHGIVVGHEGEHVALTLDFIL